MRIAGIRREWIQMIIWQHPAHLAEVYPPRNVNNIYLDTLSLSNYFDHINGIPERKKVRIRWYGQLDDGPHEYQLEIKRKEGWTMTKQVHPLSPFPLPQMLTTRGLRQSLNADRHAPALWEMVARLQPTLLNRYHRRYFQTRDGRVRVTVDTDLRFSCPDRFNNALRGGCADDAVVVEIKYDETEADHAAAVISHFPLPLNKNSKYVNGIQLLHGRS